MRPLIEPLRPERRERVGLLRVLDRALPRGLQPFPERPLPTRRPVRRRLTPTGLIFDVGVRWRRPLDQELLLALLERIQRELAAAQHQRCRQPVRRRHKQKLRLNPLGHRRLEPLVDVLLLHLPRLIDDTHRGAVPVHAVVREDHPAGAVRDELDLDLAVRFPHPVLVRAVLRPQPGGALHLDADPQVVPGVQDVLRLPNRSF